MPKVKYVGAKLVKTDNVAGTKIVWVGNGDVQEVDDATWAKLSRHPDIWERVEDSRPKPSLADVVVNTPVSISDIVRKKPGPKPKAKTE